MVVQRKLMPSAATRGSVEPSVVTNGRRPMKVFADPAALGMLEKFAGSSIGDTNRHSLSLKTDLVSKTNSEGVVHALKTATDLSSPTRQSHSVSASRSEGLVPSSTVAESRIADEFREDLAKYTEQKLDVNRHRKTCVTSSCVGDEREEEGDMAHQELKYSQSDINRMRKEWQLSAAADVDACQRRLSSELDEANARIAQLARTNHQMSEVIKEYNKTLSDMAMVKEASQKKTDLSLAELTKARDQAFEDTQAVEKAFADLHRRFEKTKAIVISLHKNEGALKETISQYENKFIEQEDRYDDLLKQARQKLISYHSKLEQSLKSSECEIARLRASMKKSAVRTDGLEQSLQQKSTEISELTKICDDLISRAAGES